MAQYATENILIFIISFTLNDIFIKLGIKILIKTYLFQNLKSRQKKIYNFYGSCCNLDISIKETYESIVFADQLQSCI